MEKSHSVVSKETVESSLAGSVIFAARLIEFDLAMRQQRRDKNQRRPFLNRAGWAEKWGVSQESVKRLVTKMREVLKLPVAHISARGGYGYTEDAAPLPLIQITHGELMAVCTMMRFVEPYESTPHLPMLRSAMGKLLEALNHELNVDVEALEKAISFRTCGLDKSVDPVIFDMLLRAIMARHEVTIDYSKLHEAQKDAPAPPQIESRRLEPLHISCIDNVWYLFAWDLRQNDIRCFALSRISDAGRTGRIFEPRPFDIDEYLKCSFGVFRDEHPADVRLRFSGKPARIVAERKWHKSQKMKSLPGDELEMRLRIYTTPDFKRWIYGWSGSVEVLEPADLRDAVRDAALATAVANGYQIPETPLGGSVSSVGVSPSQKAKRVSKKAK